MASVSDRSLRPLLLWAALPLVDCGPRVPEDSEPPLDSTLPGDSAPMDDSGTETVELCPVHVPLDIGHKVEFGLIDELPWTKLTGMYALPLEGGGWRAWVKAKNDDDAWAVVRVFVSPDGLSWEPRSFCGVEYEDWVASVGTVTVLPYNERWWMWLRADDSEVHQWVGSATSADGCAWTMNPGYFGGEEAWADDALMAPHVIEGPDNRLWMFYRGSPDVNQMDSAIGLAFSTDGRSWTPHPDNPIFPPSDDGWDSSLVGGPHVWFQDGRWLMLYSGHDREVDPAWDSQLVGTGKRMGLAASEDAIHWTRCSPEPLFVNGTKDDNPFVLEVDGEKWLYYRTTDDVDAKGGEIWRTAWPH